VHRAQHERARGVEEMDLERAEVTEKKPGQDGKPSLSLLGCVKKLNTVDLDRVLVSRLEAEQLDELLLLDDVNFGGALNGGQRLRHDRSGRGRLEAQRRPLKSIMPCTTLSLASAISPASRARSAQSSQTFFSLPSTFTDTSASASSPQLLQVGIGRFYSTLFAAATVAASVRGPAA
jgi:hypothetical protein